MTAARPTTNSVRNTMWKQVFGSVALVGLLLGCQSSEEETEAEGSAQATRRACPRFDEADRHYREAMATYAEFNDKLPTYRISKDERFADFCGGPTPLATWDSLVKAVDACPSFGDKLMTDDATLAKILRGHTARFIEYGFVSGLLPKRDDGLRDWSQLGRVLLGQPRFTFDDLSLQFDHVGGARLRTPAGSRVDENLGVTVLMMGGPTGTPVISLKNDNIALSLELRVVERGPGLLPYVSGLVVTSSEYGNEGAVFVPNDVQDQSAADWATACE